MINQNTTLQVLPRRRWTRDVPLFSKDPNLCTRTFNEELLALLGSESLIETFQQFSSNSRKDLTARDINGSVQPTICRKFFYGDGLHPNQTGSKLLGALISRSVCRALECERSQTSASPPRTVRSQFKDVTVKKVCSGVPAIPPPASPPRMIFVDAQAPPPHMDDIFHFPALPDNQHSEGCKNHTGLTGYSEAVRSQPKPKKSDGDLTQLKTSSPPPKKKKDCKYRKIIEFLKSLMQYKKRLTEKIFFI